METTDHTDGPNTPHDALLTKVKRAAQNDLKESQGTIESIVLFGSRARGTHYADSDWDIALISPKGSDARAPRLEAMETVQIIGLPRSLLAKHGRAVDTLEAYIIHDGQVLAGAPIGQRWPRYGRRGRWKNNETKLCEIGKLRLHAMAYVLQGKTADAQIAAINAANLLLRKMTESYGILPTDPKSPWRTAGDLKTPLLVHGNDFTFAATTCILSMLDDPVMNLPGTSTPLHIARFIRTTVNTEHNWLTDQYRNGKRARQAIKTYARWVHKTVLPDKLIERPGIPAIRKTMQHWRTSVSSRVEPHSLPLNS